jgi:hypothetical protein
MLRTCGVRFACPSAEILVKVGHACNVKVMNVIPGRNALDSSESRVLQSAGQNEMSD